MSARTPKSRRGSVYLLVLLTAAFVLATGLAALSLEARSHDRSDLHSEVSSSRLAVRTGLDLALQHLEENPNWRDSAIDSGLVFKRDVYVRGMNSTITAFATAMSGSPYIDEFEQFELSIRATSDRATGRLAVLVVPRPIPMDVLELGFYSGARARLDSTVTIVSDADLGASQRLEGGGQVLGVSLESETEIRTLSTTADAAVGVNPREVPGSSLIDTYASRASEIETGRLVTDAGAYVIEDVVIGPGLNPYGASNEEGLYVLHNGSSEVIVRNTRVIGTFITTGTGGVTLEESVNISPTTESWPVLLTRGSLTVVTSGEDLSESKQGVNYNPTGLKLSAQVTLSADIDLFDTYPNVLDGIVFTASSLRIGPGVCTATGSVVALGQIEVVDGATLNLTEDPNARENPPLGFESSRGYRMHPVEWLDP